jgi:hypothetical protein
MTREEELASLLSEIGLERGVAIEQLAGDLARLNLPGFLDARAFRAALLDALEYQLRSQLESTIAELRGHFGAMNLGASPASHNPQPRIEPPRSQPVAPPRESPTSPAEPAAQVTEPELPDDATIHWEPGQGQRRT